ncbi:MAG: hypothetical protein CVV31_12580 [Methanomicrobiales archaeon HGW-Methanomicrobiales-2]|nr:MAG: hypothetical protein CVV31_12580 [Methanomicrobiales archaeon HGW-Methanomicrobiales-2]
MTKFGIFLLLLLFLVPAATAATISISPDAIESGDTVTVNVNDLPDGAAFSLGIRGEFAATPNSTFAFTARDLTLPFALTSGEVNAYTKGTNWTELSAELPDGGSVIMRYNADSNDELWISQPRNIPAGTLSLVTLRGEANATSIIADLTVLGTKQGPNDGTISFAIEGVDQGTATVTVFVDGSQALSRAIAIGSSSPTPTATATATSSPGSSGGNGGNGGSTGPTPGSATVTSADGKASLTGTDTGGAGLLALSAQGTLPAGWSTAGRAYAVTPVDREFDPAATLSFSLPAAGTTATIARYEDGAWTAVPSRIEGDHITTTVARGGSYVLLVAASAPEQTATTVTTATPAATSTTVSVTTTPAAAPVAPLLPVIAFAILMLDWKRRG